MIILQHINVFNRHTVSAHLNLHDVVCLFYLNKAVKKKKNSPQPPPLTNKRRHKDFMQHPYRVNAAFKSGCSQCAGRGSLAFPLQTLALPVA